MDRKELVARLAEKLMHAHGFGDDTRSTSPIEWDPDVKDSQYAMLLEDAEAVLNELEELDDVAYEIPEAMTGGLGNYIFNNANTTSTAVNSYIYTPPNVSVWPWTTPVENVAVDPDPNVCTTVQITHRLADNSTLSELREWLEKAELLELPEDTKIAGHLHVSVVLRNAFVERYTEDPGFEKVRSYAVSPDPESDST